MHKNSKLNTNIIEYILKDKVNKNERVLHDPNKKDIKSLIEENSDSKKQEIKIFKKSNKK